MTQEEADAIVNEVNRKLKPIEDAFMAYVYADKVIGYGRMIQLIREHWDKELGLKRTVSMPEGDGKGFIKDIP